MRKKVRKKYSAGFTLTELVVTIAVSAIILSMLAISFVNINKNFDKNNYQTSKMNDYEVLISSLQDFVYESKNANFGLSLIDNNAMLCCSKIDEPDRTFGVQDNYIYINNDKKQHIDTVESIKFSFLQENLVCVVSFSNETQLKYVV